MALLIKDGAIAVDSWRQVFTEEELEAAGSTESQCLLLSLPLWLKHAQNVARQGHAVGIWLGPDDEPDELAPALNALPIIAIQFPTFTDGRGYSLARLLRGRYGFSGELRAIGDVLRDQVYLLHRCGFNAFALREDQSPDEAIAALQDYSWNPEIGC